MVNFAAQLRIVSSLAVYKHLFVVVTYDCPSVVLDAVEAIITYIGMSQPVVRLHSAVIQIEAPDRGTCTAMQPRAYLP